MERFSHTNDVSLPCYPNGLRRLASLVDEHWSSLAQLQVLDLSRNELRELPPSIGNLGNLQHLNITKYVRLYRLIEGPKDVGLSLIRLSANNIMA